VAARHVAPQTRLVARTRPAAQENVAAQDMAAQDVAAQDVAAKDMAAQQSPAARKDVDDARA